MPLQPGAACLGISVLDFSDDILSVRFESVPDITETYIEAYNVSIYPKPE